MANDDLVNLLYYEGRDPLSEEKLTQDMKNREIFNKLIKVIPHYQEDENNKSVLIAYIQSGNKIGGNSEFKTVKIAIDIIVPLDCWMIKDSNLRPFAILGEVQNSLEGKTVNGLGKIVGGDFELTRLTDKTSIYS
jgi:hypothetical protein